MKWKYRRKTINKERGYTSPEEWTMGGLIATKYLCCNAHRLSVRRSINGSGGSAFGGADEWPTVKLSSSFQKGEERKARDFARQLKIFVAKFCNDQLNPGLKRSR